MMPLFRKHVYCITFTLYIVSYAKGHTDFYTCAFIFSNWVATVTCKLSLSLKTYNYTDTIFDSKTDQLSCVSACFIGSQVSCLLSYKGFCCVWLIILAMYNN